MHGIGGGVISRSRGGDFWQGVVSQGLTHYSSKITNMNRLLGDSLPGSTAMQATIGGTISSLSGGSFQNGAMTATFAHLYNHWQHTNFQHFTDIRYGNYAGQGHYEDHLYPNPAHSPHIPMDAIDAAARQHDIDYYNNNIEWSLTHSNSIRLHADRRFLNSINAIPSNQLTLNQKMYRFGANLFFGNHVYLPKQ